ncbi:TetR family transcriptional regulator [Nocardioides zeae]|uniref:TetR family transcriptional regulator n=1 Tax=Nocardioides zeae TaxID=1457234 RepID=A0A6P0HH43_9ACTN|nr:TetR family transcriptional regulator [Nocardioides zeae]
MPRPSKPLISRHSTVQAALEIIDSEGLEALSLPRLARHMNVKAPSLYHHFSDKSEILAAVAREIVAKTVQPRKPTDGDWQGWFVQLSLNFRTAVLRHRRAAPILLEFLPRELLTTSYEDVCTFLIACEVPVSVHVLLLDGLEKLSLGSTIAEAMRPTQQRRVAFPHIDPERHPHLLAAQEANDLTPRQVFEQTVRSYLVGMERLVQVARLQRTA